MLNGIGIRLGNSLIDLDCIIIWVSKISQTGLNIIFYSISKNIFNNVIVTCDWTICHEKFGWCTKCLPIFEWRI